ncbi:MAG: hypothetical protein IPG58_11400 [Acidobacteria bacterium]|nr:hypothetical protein [Acidobacteriota bacterium]
MWKNGDRYIGSFKSAKRNGFGIFYRVSGDVYEGNYVDDKREGRGKYLQTALSTGEYKTAKDTGGKRKNVIVRGLWQHGGYIAGTNPVINKGIADAKAQAEAPSQIVTR